MANIRNVNESDTFPVAGGIAMAVAVLLPVILFVGILGNWNERHPTATVILTILIGLIAGIILVRTYIKANYKWLIWVFVAFFLYGMALGYWGI